MEFVPYVGRYCDFTFINNDKPQIGLLTISIVNVAKIALLFDFLNNQTI